MSRAYKPLKLRDVVFSGHAADGVVILRAVDGNKLLSKQLSISEAVAIRDWFNTFIRMHRYSNHVPANIDEIVLTPQDLDTIRQRFENGEPLQKLADEFSVPLQMIMGISRT